MTNAEPTTFETEGLFYQADIQADAILSHPWLVEKRLGVIPHLKALTVLEPELALLRGGILDPPSQMEQEAESTFWVDHVLAEQSVDLQEWFTLDMSLPPDHSAPAAEVDGGTPWRREGEPTSQLARDPPYPPHTLPWRERPP